MDLLAAAISVDAAPLARAQSAGVATAAMPSPTTLSETSPMIGKYCVIGALLAGVLAFFLPFISMQGPGPERKPTEYTFSVMKLMQGAEGIKDAVAEKVPEASMVSEEDTKKLGEAMDALKGMLLIPFVPTAFFLLITLLGLKRFGRGLGVFSLLVGLVALAGWALLNAAMGAANEEDVQAEFQIGFTMLLIGALFGIIGGIMGIAKPQPKAA
jgi:hypothetical protein